MANEFFHTLSNFSTNTWIFVTGLFLFFLLYIFRRKILWKLLSLDDEIAKILSQKKSSEVRTGKVAETLAPLMDDFPVDIKKPSTSTHFLGQPVDFIHIDPEEGITFIEVKSVNAKLSPSQREIKRLVLEKKVRWCEFRVK